MILNSHYVTTREELGEHNIERLIIDNPVYYNNEKLGFSNRGVPKKLKLFTEKDGKLYIPRNAPVSISTLLHTIKDERSQGHPINVESKIELRDDQKPAVEAIMRAGDGILEAGTGKGKSVMACEVIARFGRTAIILVHKEFLMDQFTEHLKKWLGLTEDEIGYARGNPANWTWKGKKVVIGMLQSIYTHIDNLPEGFKEYFGLVISDECHRVSASTWSQVIQIFPAWKRLGLTATPKRADGLETIFHYHLGQIVYRLTGLNMKPTVHLVRTKVLESELPNIKIRGEINLSRLISRLAEHEERNKLILKVLLQAAKAGRKIIVLSDRRGHAEFLKESFDLSKKSIGLDVETRLYLGGMEKEVRQEAEENGDILFGTFQMAKEGLDIPELDTLFLVTPNSSKITVQQSIGRIARSKEGKKNPMVVDFVDVEIPICNALFNKRMKVYQSLELEVK